MSQSPAATSIGQARQNDAGDQASGLFSPSHGSISCSCELFAFSLYGIRRVSSFHCWQKDAPMLSPVKAGSAERVSADIPADATRPYAGAITQGWRRASQTPPLAEVFGTIRTVPTGSTWRKLLAFLGPGYLVAVGYMDPGNWATSLAGGSKFGYALLFIALLSNIMAIILQALCARLGVGAGRDLAQACRDAFPRCV